MLAALSRNGWTNYFLFLKSDGLLVGYVETPDFKKAVDGMQTEQVNSRWQAAMKDFSPPSAPRRRHFAGSIGRSFPS